MNKDIEKKKKTTDIEKMNNSYLKLIYKDIHFIKNVFLVNIVIFVIILSISILVPIFNALFNAYRNTNIKKDCCIDNDGTWQNNACINLETPYSYDKCIEK